MADLWVVQMVDLMDDLRVGQTASMKAVQKADQMAGQLAKH